MARYATPGFVDGGIDKIATSVQQVLCSATPSGYADIANVALASVSMVPQDFSKTTGDNASRVLTVAEKSGGAILATGTATRCVLTDGTDYLVTETSSKAIVYDGISTVNFPSWTVVARNFTAP